ncbi:MAG: aquaporin family protein, partial [Bradyrhizobium sp.]
IRPLDLPGFIIAELVGALCALALMTWLLRLPADTPSQKDET